MTIQGAIYELNNMLSSNDIPCYWKPAIKKIIETVEQNVGEISEQTDGDLISRKEAEKCCLDGWNKDYKDILEDIRKLPSAGKTAE